MSPNLPAFLQKIFHLFFDIYPNRNKHVPMIEHTKDGKYKLRNANGKSVLHEEYTDAVKLALEVYEKFKKLNKNFEE